MVRVIYVDHSGVRRTIELTPGQSVMEGAVRNGVPGINGDCGGACACATCHVYVEDGWADRVPPPDETEVSMLEFAYEVEGNSRLACQIIVNPALDGLVVKTPGSQQ